MLSNKTAAIGDIDLESYLKQYDSFDPAHDRRHAEAVRQQAKLLAAKYYPGKEDLADLAGALHDIGLSKDREGHEQHGFDILSADELLKKNLAPDELDEVLEAVREHRASSGNPSGMLAKIISDADRLGSTNPLRRAYDYRKHNFPDMSDDDAIRDALSHMKGKYGKGGYGSRYHFDETKEHLSKLEKDIDELIASGDIEKAREYINR
jgi:uncharacterized protein